MVRLKLSDTIEHYSYKEEYFETEEGLCFKLNDVEGVFNLMLDFGIVEDWFADEVNRTDLDYTLEYYNETFVDYLNELNQRSRNFRLYFEYYENI